MDQSFNILASDYRPMIVAYLRSLGADAHLAEDLAQETFLAAYQSLNRFDEEGNLGAWLRGIARNKTLMHWRAAAARDRCPDTGCHAKPGRRPVACGKYRIAETATKKTKDDDGCWRVRRRSMYRVHVRNYDLEEGHRRCQRNLGGHRGIG